MYENENDGWFPRPPRKRSMLFYVIFWPLALAFNVAFTLLYYIEGCAMVGKGRLSSRIPIKVYDEIEHVLIWGIETFTHPESPWNDGPLF